MRSQVFIVVFSMLCFIFTGFTVNAAERTVKMEDIVITATKSRHSLQNVPVETYVITREDIERMPSQNIVDILKTVPGINTSLLDDVMGADNLRTTMRGLQFNEGYGLILIDGQRAHGELGAHGEYGVSLNQIPLGMIERIEIVKGAASSLYGADALAGVVNIITRKVPRETTSAAGVSYGRYDILERRGISANQASRDYSRANVSHGGSAFGNSGYSLHYSFEQDEGITMDPATSDRHSLISKWHTDLTSDLSVNLGANLSQARRKSTNPLARYDREYDTYRFSGGMDYQFGNHELSLKGYTYWQDFLTGFKGFDHGYRYGKIGYDQAEATYNWYTDLHILTVGAATQAQSLDYSFENFLKGKLQAKVPVKKTVITNSLYVQDELMLFDKRLTLVPGVRVENHSTFGTEVNPKFSAMFKAMPTTTVRGSVGRAFKSPTIRQLYYGGIYRHDNDYIRSNPDLNPETAINYSMNLEQQLMDERLSVNVGYFHTDLKDMVVRHNTGERSDGFPILSFINVQKALIQGGELSAQLALNDAFSVNAGFNYTASENKATGKELPYVPKYTLSLAPTYVYQPWGLGFSVIPTHVGKQYRDVNNIQEVGEHTVIDARVWKQFSKYARLSLEGKNLTASDKGDSEYDFRMGRSIGLNLEIQF